MAYCVTCNKSFHPLGIMRHRAMHRDKREDCVIELQSGTFSYNFSDMPPPLFRERNDG